MVDARFLVAFIAASIAVIAGVLYGHRWSGGEFEQRVEKRKK